MSSPTGTLESLASRIGSSLAVLQIRLDPSNVVDYFEQLGILFPDTLSSDSGVVSSLNVATGAAGALGSAVDTLTGAQSGSSSAAQVVSAGVAVVGAIATLLTALDSLATTIGGKAGSWAPLAASDVTAFTGNLTDRILSDSIIGQFEIDRPDIVTALVLLGVIDRPLTAVVGADPTTVLPVPIRQLKLNNLADALTSPTTYLKTLVNWGSSPFDATPLLERLQEALSVSSQDNIVDTSSGTPTFESFPFTVTANTGSPPGVDFVIHPPIPANYGFTTSLRPGFSFTLSTTGSLPAGVRVSVNPPSKLSVAAPVAVGIQGQLSRTPIAPETAVVLLGQTGGAVLQADSVNIAIGLSVTTDPSNTSASGDVFAKLSLAGGKAVVDFSQSDGFIKTITSGVKTEAAFDLAATYSVANGLTFSGAAGITIRIPVHISLGPVEFDAVYISLGVKSGGFLLELSVEIKGSLGPVSVDVDRIGLSGTLSFPSAPNRGNLGPAELDVGFRPPSGVGIVLDAGPVSGGGFLSVTDTRYAGAIELSVYGIAVKAFGLIDTVLPDGSKGYSFVVVISAEFTPIQLGFGFTLLGVGGLVGINRTIDSKALQAGVQSGSIANVLFPKNVVKDAPAIINDLARFFPAASGHYLFGPMAKLGWGTPTLIHGQIGIILEIPGPRLSLLGIVNAALPTADAAVISINMAIGGMLDFPGRLFWLSATLYDSHVVGFQISGGMAFRITWGDNPNFALAVGGFNPAYEPPPDFPSVPRCAVSFGIDGNPSITCQSYFAVTSNTAQTGAAIDLRASGYGIDLSGHLGFDALFIFSPFSFQIDFNASVNVSFEGVGFGLGLHGTISGPTPWHIQAQVCVSVLFWDACLPIDITFGTNKRTSLPQMDPWTGHDDKNDASNVVLGLQAAIADTNNWSGGFPTGAFPVVTLTQSATASKQPIDPVGEATLHQKVLPLNYQLSKFGIYQPIKNTKFTLQSVTIGSGSPITNLTMRQDYFAPALFKDMKGDEKLSTPSYEKHDSGFTIAPDNVVPGDINAHKITYDTDVIDPAGNDNAGASFDLPLRHLLAMLAKGASALGGIRRSGAQTFVDPTAPVLVHLSDEGFVVADACSLVANTSVTPAPLARSAAQSALDAHVQAQPSDAGQFRVIPAYLAA
jgi:hypothetical protein